MNQTKAKYLPVTFKLNSDFKLSLINVLRKS